MDTSDPSITFSEKGICNHCEAYEKAFRTKTFFGVQQVGTWEEIFENIKVRGQRKPYDCVIGLSGGVDSSYLAYFVKTNGLRPLAIHVDNGWNSELAVSNIENICKKLEIDLRTNVLAWREFRDIQIAFLKASTPDAEIPSDHAIVATLYMESRKHGVPVLAGYNARTESHMPAAWSQGYFDARYIKAIHRRFGAKVMHTFPTINWWQAQKYVRNLCNVLNYIDYNKKDAMEVVTRELGWRNYGKKHSESLYTKFFQECYLPQKFGFDKRRSHFSSLVAAGEITREAALLEMGHPPCSPNESAVMLEYVLKKLEITRDEYRRIEAAPARRFEDYPSYEKLQRSFMGHVVRDVYRGSLKRWL